MTGAELQEGELYRFIKVDGQYEFDLVTATGGNSHRAMADNRKVEAAGYLAFNKNHIKIPEPWSSTLGIGCMEVHYQELEKLLGKKIKGKWD